VDKNLICCICLDPVENARIHNLEGCENIFCLSCIQMCDSCPKCRKDITDSISLPTKIIRNMLNELMMQCNDCHTKMNRELFINHFENECLVHECEFCGINVTRKQLNNHSNICPKIIVNCFSPNCLYKSTRDSIENHNTKCVIVQVAYIPDEEKVMFLTEEVIKMNDELNSTKNELIITKTQLVNTQNELSNLELILKDIQLEIKLREKNGK